LRRLFERFPGTSFADLDQVPHWRPGKFMRRLDNLPVILN
jgi:hypothetical protein